MRDQENLQNWFTCSLCVCVRTHMRARANHDHFIQPGLEI